MQQCEYPNMQNVELQNIIEKGKKNVRLNISLKLQQQPIEKLKTAK